MAQLWRQVGRGVCPPPSAPAGKGINGVKGYNRFALLNTEDVEREITSFAASIRSQTDLTSSVNQLVTADSAPKDDVTNILAPQSPILVGPAIARGGTLWLLWLDYGKKRNRGGKLMLTVQQYMLNRRTDALLEDLPAEFRSESEFMVACVLVLLACPVRQCWLSVRYQSIY